MYGETGNDIIYGGSGDDELYGDGMHYECPNIHIILICTIV